MTELSAAKLAGLREIAGKATPGPWEIDLDGDIQGRRPGRPSDPEMDPMVEVGGRESADTEYIAAFDPPTVLALLDRIEEQQAELDVFREREAASVLEFDAVTRVEVIETGQRGYVKRSSEPGATLFLQDNFRTLKVFIDSDGDGDEPR